MHMYLQDFVNKISDNFWEIGFVETDICDVLKSKDLPIRWVVNPYKDRWFADPYILNANKQEIVVLAEEFSYNLRKGRIAKLLIDRKNYVIKEMKIILELETHLSFPVIYRVGDKTYIMPENSASGSLIIYEYDIDTDSLSEKSAVSNLPLTDATIFKAEDGKSYVLSTKTPNQNGSSLSIFHFDPATFTASDEPIQDIKFSSNIARNAGNVFKAGDFYYRPSQDCNKCYGNGVCIQRLNYEKGFFSFENVITYYSQSRDLDMGLHTFNKYGNIIVVDGHGHRFKKAYGVYKFLRELKMKLVSNCK